jgi:hypothetical protein
MTANDSSFPLLKLVPPVLRARGYRLYTQDGRRLVDLWLNGGAAILGHTPANMLRELKNTASRGLYSPLPHFTEGRYLKALSKLLPDYFFRIYAAPPTELIKIDTERDSHGGTKAQRRNEGGLRFWRPFNSIEEPFAVEEGLSLFIPVLPGVQTWRIQEGIALPLGLCVVAARDEKLLKELPPSDALPPVLLAVATRGVHDILAAQQRAAPLLPKVFKALQNSRCIRRGIYLYLKEEAAPDMWAELFKKFLEAGFLLPPSPLFPVILPGELSEGEEAKLAEVLRLR